MTGSFLTKLPCLYRATMKRIARASLAAMLLWALCFSVAYVLTDDTPQRALRSTPVATPFPVHEAFGKSRGEVFGAILSTNSQVIAWNLAGVATFGVSTVSNLAINGLVLGGFLKMQVLQGASPPFLLRYTLPHSLEFIGVWLSGGIGLSAAWLVFRWLCGKPSLDRASALSLLMSAVASAVIIIVAAWLEVFVTLRDVL